MNAKQRRALAYRLADIAKAHCGHWTLEEIKGSRCTTFEARWNAVFVSVDIDDIHGGGLFAAWYGATRPLADSSVFDSVNPYHRRKASLYRDNAAAFLEAFAEACAAVADGSAFLPDAQA